MNNKNHRALFDAVSDIDDDLIEAAAAPKVLSFTKRILRVAAIAAVIAILMTALFLLDGSNSPAPYFSVYVYADGDNGIELNIEQNTVICNCDRSNDQTYRPIFDSNTNSETATNPYNGWFYIRIRLDDRTKDYQDISVLVDNKDINQFTAGTVLLGYTSSQTEGRTGFSLLGDVEKPTKIDLILYNDSSNILQSYTVMVTPMDDGYKIVLEEAYVTADSKNVFSHLG